MRFLTEVPDSLAAAELVDRLQQASCFAIFVERPDETSIRTYVYVSDDVDMEYAAEVLQQFHADGLISRGTKCDRCAYDLRGHTGQGRCPECGRRFQIHEDTKPGEAGDAERRCSSCGEDVPSNFQCCWNCGEAIGQ